MVRALIMPALRPLKSLNTSSTVRGLYGTDPASIDIGRSGSFARRREKKKGKKREIGERKRVVLFVCRRICGGRI